MMIPAIMALASTASSMMSKDKDKEKQGVPAPAVPLVSTDLANPTKAPSSTDAFATPPGEGPLAKAPASMYRPQELPDVAKAGVDALTYKPTAPTSVNIWENFKGPEELSLSNLDKLASLRKMFGAG